MTELPESGVTPPSAEDRSDWLPPMWTRGRLNRWWARSPGRMVVWFFGMPLLGLVATVVTATSGSWRWIIFAVPTVLLTRQSVTYGPRAWRAYRNQN